MGTKGGSFPLQSSLRWHSAGPVRKRTVTFFFLLAIVLYFTLDSYRESPQPWRRYDGVKISKDFLKHLGEAPLAPDNTTQRSLHLFVVADSPHLDLCKTVISAVALGYPFPVFVNWEGSFNRPDWAAGRSHVAKLESLLAAIEHMYDIEEVQDDDLAISIDGRDVWFQLPPSVLIDRFNLINDHADKRLAKEWEWMRKDHFPIHPPRQNILVSAAKDCQPSPSSASDPHYDYWPESPVRGDLYGHRTDEVLPTDDPATRFQNFRPRCANTGMIMGTMGALRASLKRAMEKIDLAVTERRRISGHEDFYAEVIGDQFMSREWVKQLAESWDGGKAVVDLEGLTPEVRAIAYGTMKERRRYEFGIGVDYEFLTMPSTSSAEEDGKFVMLDDKRGIKRASKKAGVTGEVRVKGVPRDLKRPKVRETYPYTVPWGEMPLYTDLFFGSTPVAIHHNANDEEVKKTRLREWWESMWFYPDLRALVLVNINRAYDARTVGRKEVLDRDIVYYNASAQDQPVAFQLYGEESVLEYVSWEGVCQTGREDWAQPMFGDGEGPLIIDDKSWDDQEWRAKGGLFHTKEPSEDSELDELEELEELEEPLPKEPVPEASKEPVPEASKEPVPEASEEPVPEASEEPVPEVSKEPVPEPSKEPLLEASEEPVPKPSEEPVPEPSGEPVLKPSEEPVPEPSEEPVLKPSGEQVPEPPESPEEPPSKPN